jgi:TonB family protein
MKKFLVLFLICFISILPVFSEELYGNPNYINKMTNSQFEDYMENVKNKLQENWSTPDFMITGHARILFKLDNEGYVISARIIESSGNQIFDESTIYSLQKSEPFGKFPEGVNRDNIVVNYSFDTTLIKTDKMRNYLEISDRSYKNGYYQNALENINLAISEVQGEEKAYYLYERRANIYKALNENLKAKEDYDKYQMLKKRIDIKRAHFIKHFAEVENSPFAYFYLAYCYEQIGEYENAISAIDKSIAMTDLNNQYKRYRADLVSKTR